MKHLRNAPLNSSHIILTTLIKIKKKNYIDTYMYTCMYLKIHPHTFECVCFRPCSVPAWFSVCRSLGERACVGLLSGLLFCMHDDPIKPANERHKQASDLCVALRALWQHALQNFVQVFACFSIPFCTWLYDIICHFVFSLSLSVLFTLLLSVSAVLIYIF